MTGVPRYRMVIVEGLPGSGKSTTAHLLRLHLQRQGLPVRWWWEHEDPHPVFDYSVVQEALDDGKVRDGLFDEAIARWSTLAQEPRWVLLDGSFLQTPLHAMLLNGWTPDSIAQFVRQAAAAITPAAPLIVLLQPTKPEAALRETTASRGNWFMELLDWRVRRSVYGCRHDLTGPAGVISYFEAYTQLVRALVAQLDLPVLVLDGPRSDFVDRIAAALGLPPFAGLDDPARDSGRFVGTYHATGEDDVYEVVEQGRHLWLDGTPRTRLVPRADTVFELLGTCVTFDFSGADKGQATTLHCRGDLPGLASEWARVA